jgi:hypothetical protein
MWSLAVSIIFYRKVTILSLALLVMGLFSIRLIYPPVSSSRELAGLTVFEIEEVVQKEVPIGCPISQVKTWIDSRHFRCDVINSDCETFIADLSSFPSDDLRIMSAIVPSPHKKADELNNSWLQIDFMFSADGKLIKSKAGQWIAG